MLKVSHNNAIRAVGKPPATFKDHVRILKSLLRDCSAKQDPPTAEEIRASGGGGGGNSGDGDSKALNKLRDELGKLKRRTNKGEDDSRRTRSPKKPRGPPTGENKIGRPVFNRRDAKDDKDKGVCVNWSLKTCKDQAARSCTYNGRELVHKCSVVTGMKPLKICLRTDHAAGEGCPHWRD